MLLLPCDVLLYVSAVGPCIYCYCICNDHVILLIYIVSLMLILYHVTVWEEICHANFFVSRSDEVL